MSATGNDRPALLLVFDALGLTPVLERMCEQLTEWLEGVDSADRQGAPLPGPGDPRADEASA